MRRAVAVAAVLLSVSAATASPVFADVNGQAFQSQTLTSATWKATPSATSFTFSSGSASPAQYFSVTNTGTLTLLGASYDVSVTSGSGAVSVRACSLGGWNESLNLCAGTTTTVVTTANSPQSVNGLGQFPVATGSFVRLQISDVGVGSVTVSFTASIDRSQARAATTTKS